MAALGEPGTEFKLLPSHSKNSAPTLKIPGLVIIKTLPSGSKAAGPSAISRLPGKSGPAVHVPVFES